MAEAGKEPDATLAVLYNSSRPPVELLPGVSLSPIVNACWLPSDYKTMMAESWLPAPPADDAEPTAPLPAFDPASIEYTELKQRLSKSLPLIQWNGLMIKAKELELEKDKMKDGPDKDAKNEEVEAAKAQLAEVEAQLTELKASFQEEPVSLVPWMRNLFQLADAGLTTFEVSGHFFPYTKLRSLFGGDNTSSLYDGEERLLGVFKKRYEKERGPGKIQVLLKMVPNIYQDGFSAAIVEPLVDKMREAVYGAEAPEALDLVQLYWWDLKDSNVLPVLKVLQKLSEDKLEVNEETGEVSITEPKKIKGIALVDFPPRAILSAIQAGVPIVAAQMPFSIADRSYGKALSLCLEYGIKVFAREGTLGGLVSEKYLGVAPLESIEADADLDEVPHCLELANNIGGWAKLQALLRKVKAIADKHGVKMQTVSLRWQIDLGTFPVVTTRWGQASWRQFGFNHWASEAPGLDAQLFQVESFLDEDDMRTLKSLAS